MMDMRETLSVAIDALRANKLRAILTSLGVIIGSASIVLVVTVALTSQKYVISQIEAIGSNMVYVELINASSKTTPLKEWSPTAPTAAMSANARNADATIAQAARSVHALVVEHIHEPVVAFG